MIDYPRFEPVRGDPDVAHEAYHGGALVTLVFRLVDRWRSRAGKRQQAHGIRQTGSAIEIHERPPVLAPTTALPGVAEVGERALYQVAPDEGFSRGFLIGSARTVKLQAGLLAAFVAVLTLLVAQGVRMHEQAYELASRHPAVVAASPAPGQALPGQELP